MCNYPGSKYVNRYAGKWYNTGEAIEIERELLKNSATGDEWWWENKDGDRVYFSG